MCRSEDGRQTMTEDHEHLDILERWALLPADVHTALLIAEELDALRDTAAPETVAQAARYFVRRFPAYRLGWETLIESLRRGGRTDEAADVSAAFVAMSPDTASAYWHRGWCLHDAGVTRGAVEQWTRVATLKRGDMDVRCSVADSLLSIGCWQEASDLYQVLLTDVPDNRQCLINNLIAIDSMGDIYRTAAFSRHAIRMSPTIDGFYTCLGRALNNAGDHERASVCFKRANYLSPKSLVPRLDLGLLLQDLGRLDESIEEFKGILKLDPASSEALLNIGNVYYEEGRVDDTFRHLRWAAHVGTSTRSAIANTVMYLHYLPSATRATIRAAIDDFSRRFASAPDDRLQAFSKDADPDRPLTVGLVSSGFHRHPALGFSIKALENLDRTAFRLIAYHGRPRRDDLTQRLETFATMKMVGAMNDDRLIEEIRADGVDILIDMAGHGYGVRLGIYPKRPAPVQVKWVGGLFNTTGVPGVDWLIADAVQVPPGDDKWYSERIHRMPHGYVVFDPVDYAPPVWPLPAQMRDMVTFGSFNNPVKINADMVALWARVLKGVPNSRLLLKGKRFGVPEVQARYKTLFGDQGIDAARVVMRGHTGHLDHLRTYNEVDIALDPWPYSGGLTTCESLWMGVPVITWPGPTFAGRHAATHLSNVGLSDWIVDSDDAYVDLAASWAHRLTDLAALRKGLRARVAASPLCDGPRFARHLEAALRHMWRTGLAEVGLIKDGEAPGAASVS